MTWEGVGMMWEGAGMMWEGVGMMWEGVGMMWEGVGMTWESVPMNRMEPIHAAYGSAGVRSDKVRYGEGRNDYYSRSKTVVWSGADRC